MYVNKLSIQNIHPKITFCTFNLMSFQLHITFTIQSLLPVNAQTFCLRFHFEYHIRNVCEIKIMFVLCVRTLRKVLTKNWFSIGECMESREESNQEQILWAWFHVERCSNILYWASSKSTHSKPVSTQRHTLIVISHLKSYSAHKQACFDYITVLYF